MNAAKTLDFPSLAALIIARPCPHRVRLIAIDGGAGAGKTTFAAELSKHLGGCPVIPMDDFISFDDLREFWPRMEAQVLEPAFAGKPFKYQMRDWVGDMSGRGLKDWRHVPAYPILIFEGVGSARRALADRLTYSVWIETPRDTRLARGLERDKNVESVWEIWEQWMPGEQKFHEEEGARSRADLLVDGTKPYQGSRFHLLDP